MLSFMTRLLRVFSILVVLALLSAAAVVSAPGARALGCVLGPSLGGAAKAVGISCPQIDGGSGAEHWGVAGGACRFGWETTNYPPDLLDFLWATMVTRSNFAVGTSSVSLSFFRKAGKIVGGVTIVTRPDRTFTMDVMVYGRYGSGWEALRFDCRSSTDGPIYSMEPFLDNEVMPAPGAPASTSTSSSTSWLEAHGAMTALGTSNHLLRVDVTNTGSAPTIADVQFDLAGYSVDGLPVLPPGARCLPAEGLVCQNDDVAPGQTVSMVLLLRSTGDLAAGASVDVSVSGMGLRPISFDLGHVPVKKKTVVTDFYRIDRP